MSTILGRQKPVNGFVAYCILQMLSAFTLGYLQIGELGEEWLKKIGTILWEHASFNIHLYISHLPTLIQVQIYLPHQTVIEPERCREHQGS
jgi:hypothetical protein